MDMNLPQQCKNDVHCFAHTYVHKTVLSMLFFPIIITIVYIGLRRAGLGFEHFIILHQIGALTWWKTAISFSAWPIAFFRYVLPSYKALRHGMCALAREGDDLLLNGSTRIPIRDVVGVYAVSNVTKKGIIIRTYFGDEHYVCSILTNLNNPKRLVEIVEAECGLVAT